MSIGSYDFTFIVIDPLTAYVAVAFIVAAVVIVVRRRSRNRREH